MRQSRLAAPSLLAISLCALLLSSCGSDSDDTLPPGAITANDGPVNQGVTFPRVDGTAADGRDVYRFETFGNERFWTDAARLPAGIVAAGVTPLQALALGLQIDVDALDASTQAALKAQLVVDPSGRSSALLNDPAVTLVLLNANAVIGVPVKDSNGDGTLNVAQGDKVGVTCALCHTITDRSVFNLAGSGSIGKRIDGPANHGLDIGAIFAAAANSRALYPLLQLTLAANGGTTLGRASAGLTELSTEADVDAYLSNKANYPIGMFDDTFDGNGDPMHNTPLFRQDLAAPYGSEGAIARLDNFSNLVFTGLFDPTTLTTPGGRAFLNKLGGAAGDEIANDYVQVLAATNVTGYPYVVAAAHPAPGTEEAPLGIRVDNTKLINMNAYLVSLPAPTGTVTDAAAVARGREVFRTAGCTGCHNVDQGKRVPSFIVAMATIFPGDAPVTLAQRTPPLNPVLNTPASIFDDKMAVVNASLRGDIRGIALPLLLDLARKPVFLHDNSVASLDALLESSRGTTAPHPFYLQTTQRAEVVAYLRSLDTNSR